MTTFESQQTHIKKEQAELFDFFSDLNNIGKFKDKVSQAVLLKDLEYSTDSFSLTVSPVGKVNFRIIERQPCNKVLFAAENLPVDLNVEVSLERLMENEAETDLKIIATANLNPFIKPMVSKPLQEAVDKIAETFSAMFNQEV